AYVVAALTALGLSLLPKFGEVIATQNPIEQAGTYALPEAQLDRFLIKSSIGYPESAAGIEILKGSATPDRSKTLPAVISTSAVEEMTEMASFTYADESVLGYVQDLVESTRSSKDVRIGVSTRGAIAMVRAARVWALSRGRHYMLPDDVKTLALPVWAHRIVLDPDAEFGGATREAVVIRALEEVSAPIFRK
ncbi:MAG: AAA family ATPase, partial [Peptidiphaga sp.]